MAAGDRTAIFRAIGDFSRLVRDARKGRKEMGGLEDQSRATGEAIDDVGKKSDRTSTRLGRLAGGAKKLRAGLSKVQSSGFGKWLDRTDQKTRGLLKSLAKVTAVAAGLGLLGTFATASLGPVLSLVGAVAALSGAVGVLPGLFAAVKVAAGVLKVAFLGVEDAFKAMGKPGAEFAEAIKDMPPSMQRAMWEMRRMKPAVDNLRKSIQQRFWEGLSTPIRDLGKVWIPILRRRGTQLAGTFNHMAKEAAAFFTNRRNADDLSDSLGNVNKFWAQMVGAVRPLLRVLRDVFAVSSEFLPGMSKGAKGAAENFADMVSEARRTGKLKAWIREGLDQLKALGATLVNVGRMFGAVFRAGKAEGRGFFETLRDITDKFADFLESAEGQDTLRKLFRAIGDAADVAVPIVKALFKTLGEILPVLVKIGEKVGPGVERLIYGIGDAVKAAEPGMLRLGEAVGDLLAALGDAGPMIGALVSGLADALVPVVKALTWLLRTLTAVWDSMPKSMQNVVSGIGGWVLALGLGALAVAKLIKLMKSAVGVVGTLAGALNKIPGVNLPTPGKTPPAAAPVAPGTATVPIPDAGKDAEKKGKSAARRFVSALGRGIKAGAKGVAGAVAFVFSGLGTVAGKSAGGVAKAFRWATPLLASTLRLIGGAIVFLAGAFRALGLALLANPIVLIIAAIAAAAYLIITNWSTVKAWIGTFFGWLGTAAAWVRDLVVAAWQWVATRTSAIWSSVTGAIGRAVTAVRNAVGSAVAWVRNTVSAAWNAVSSKTSQAWNAAKNAVGNALSAVKNAVGSAAGWVGDKISQVGGWLSGRWSAAWRTAGDVVSAVGRGISSAINAVVDAVRTAVRAIGDALAAIGRGVSNAASWVGDRVSDMNPANWFGQGGLVGGETGHKQIMAEQGEYVVPKGAARKWLPWLRAINPYDRGSLQASMGDMLSGVAGSAPTFGAVASSSSAGYTAPAGEPGGVRDVHVTQIVNNPLPEKPSETASRRMGRAAKLGVASVVGGVA